MKNDTTSEIVRFEVGKTYATRSACNHDCVFSYTVTRRTSKFIFVDKGHGQIERRGVYIWDGVEHCKPDGTYSMCAIIDAADSELIDGEIASERRNRIAREEREAAAPKVDPQLEGIGCPADKTPLLFGQHSAEDVVRTLIDSGFAPTTLQGFDADRIIREFEAIKRRAAFRIVA